MKQHDHNEMLSQIAEAIANFLKKEGGMGNGYNTYVRGTVSYNTHQSISYHTPKTGEITGNELDERGSKLNDKLMKILKAYEYHDEVEIKPTHMEHGCFDINVSLKLSARVTFI